MKKILTILLAIFMTASTTGQVKVKSCSAIAAPGGTAHLIASASTHSRATAVPMQSKIIWDGTRYWAFWLSAVDGTKLYYGYSTDLTTWTSTNTTIATSAVDGGELAILYDSVSSTLLASAYNSAYTYYRGVLSGTTITWAAVQTMDPVTKAANSEFGTSLGLDGGNHPWDAVCDGSGNVTSHGATNVISTTFADANWSAGTNTQSMTDYCKRTKLIGLAGTAILLLGEDSGNNVWWAKGPAATKASLLSGVNVSRFNWNATKVSNTAVYLIGQDNTSSFAFYKFDGTAWGTALTAPTWPTSGLSANSGVGLVTDGTDVYAVVIRGDANNTVSYAKYTVASGTWGAWTDLVTSSATRNWVEAAWLNAKLTIQYTQTNGTNYDIYVVQP